MRGFYKAIISTSAVVILIIGIVLVVWSVPQMRSDVLASGSIMADESHNFVGTYYLASGPYSVWIEDYREEDEFDFYVASLVGEDHTLLAPDRPPERRTRELNGVEYELLAIFEDEYEGIYNLEIDQEETATPVPPREVRVLFATSTSDDAVTNLVVGILLLTVGSLMLFIVTKVWYFNRTRNDVEQP